MQPACMILTLLHVTYLNVNYLNVNLLMSYPHEFGTYLPQVFTWHLDYYYLNLPTYPDNLTMMHY